MADDINGAASLNNGPNVKTRKRGRPPGPRAATSGVADSVDGSESRVDGIESGETETGAGAQTQAETGAGAETQTGATDPQTVVNGPATGKKRGRPAGSRNQGTTAKTADAVKPGTVRELATEIAGAYWMVAQITQQPVFDIGVDRAMMIAKPLTDVQKHYPVKLDGPAFALAKLAGGILAINLPIMIYLAAQQNAKRQAQRAQRATVASTPEEIVIPGATQKSDGRQQYDFSGNA